MSYITIQDLLEEVSEQRLLQLTDNNKTGQIDQAKVQKAISFAVGTFESYARTRYTLPVPATELVKSKLFDLAIYKLERDLARTPDSIDKLRKQYYDPTIKFLEALQKGTAALDVPAAEETATNPASPDRVLSGSSKPVFTDDKFEGY